jgi:glycyl-tRNA synthetase beta chain
VRKLVEPAEHALHAALIALNPEVSAALTARQYDRALSKLATLRPTIDAFFADVMVNAEDVALRTNRLALVAAVRTAFAGVADLSRLPG